MENFLSILMRLSVSTSVLFLLYWILLRNTTHFKANRYFLIFSLIISLIIALFTLQYEVLIENVKTIPPQQIVNNTIDNTEEAIITNNTNSITWQFAVLMLYFSGLVFFSIRILVQTFNLFLLIISSQKKIIENIILIENDRYNSPFSFINKIFINPKYFKQEEIDDIIAHEKVHIHERHWIDLIIIELLTVFLWFNPFIWLFERIIKQNHEYLADQGVLSRGHSPARYQSLLINQLMGMQVVGITNNFCFALGPNRLKMMKKQKTPKRKLFRLFWTLPIIVILLYAFADPVYKQKFSNEDQFSYNFSDSIENIVFYGQVNDAQTSKPLQGASIVIKGTTNGAIADKRGRFNLTIPRSGAELVISYVGYETIRRNIHQQKPNTLRVYSLHRDLIRIEKNLFNKDHVSSQNTSIKNAKSPNIKYKTENGTIYQSCSKQNITTNSHIPSVKTNNEEPVFIVVEEMPQYPNGHYGLGQYINSKKAELKSKFLSKGQKLEGKATIGFTINDKGSVKDAYVLNKTTDIAAKAAITIVEGMEKWSPGKQRGKAVPVDFALPFEF